MLKTTPTAGAGTLPKAVDDSIFLTLEAKLTFSQLRQAFTEASILHHLDLKCYIWIKTHASSYAIGDILSQQTPESGP